MTLVLALDFLGTILLVWVFYTVWKVRSTLPSFRPIVLAIVIGIAGRICDTLRKHPEVDYYSSLGVSWDLYVLIFGIIGNLAGVVSISLITFGFIRIIRNQLQEKKHIEALEYMLPICSNCKKFRAKDNEWQPIEKYLLQSGTPKITHGICPDCAKELYGTGLPGGHAHT